MDINQDTNQKSVNDCKGTCKTPIGCTCGRKKPIKSDSLQEMKMDKLTVTDEPKEKFQSQNLNGTQISDYKNFEKNLSTKKKTSCCAGTNKLEVYDWFSAIPQIDLDNQMVEVQFKNTRKGYYLNSNDFDLNKGDLVAVEATPGHDIGEVTLTGKLVQLQMKKNNFRGDIKRIYRLAKPNDLEKAKEARAKEHATMLRAREIAEEMQLAMKISDVEYQGDGNKAIFYYIADDRVDFRQLIKVYASEFRVKIEMKQIGARQEAGRVGGIGPCGRELCCSKSMSNFVSVSTSAARIQEIPLNPQKLAGQCGKLKCCLNFETDIYLEAQRTIPARDIPLETQDSTFYHFKTDLLSGAMTYSTDKNFAANLVTLPKDRVRSIINMNRRGNRPVSLLDDNNKGKEEQPVTHDVLEQESITRFDNRSKNNKKRKIKNKNVSSDKTGKEPESKSGESADRSPEKRKQENNNRRSIMPRREKSVEDNAEPKPGADQQASKNRDQNRNRNHRNNKHGRNDRNQQTKNNEGEQ